MFADDTNIFFSHKNITDLVAIVNQELAKVSTWLKINKLSLNVTKTHFILFHFRQCKLATPVSIKIDNVAINQVKTTKFLGVIINENLSWSDHIDVVTSKCNKNLGVIRKLSYILPREVLLSLYYTLIYPYINYCNIAWASQPTTRLDKLLRIQKKAMRLITNSGRDAHALPLFSILHTLTLHDVNKLQNVCFVYCSLHDLLPTAFTHYFQTNRNIHQHATRSTDDLHMFSHSTTLRKYTTRILAPTIWNSLPNEFKILPNLSLFKKKCKFFFLKSYV
jgi:hypothetical protein